MRVVLFLNASICHVKCMWLLYPFQYSSQYNHIDKFNIHIGEALKHFVMHVWIIRWSNHSLSNLNQSFCAKSSILCFSRLSLIKYPLVKVLNAFYIPTHLRNPFRLYFFFFHRSYAFLRYLWSSSKRIAWTSLRLVFKFCPNWFMWRDN